MGGTQASFLRNWTNLLSVPGVPIIPGVALRRREKAQRHHTDQTPGETPTGFICLLTSMLSHFPAGTAVNKNRTRFLKVIK